MNKPTSYLQLVGGLLLILGVAFCFFGWLTQIGLMKVNPDSIGDPVVIFPIMGVIMLAVGVALFVTTLIKGRKQQKLRMDGTATQGTITLIKKLSYTRWSNQHPSIAHFTYEYGGVTYKGKSDLIWGAPTIHEYDKIVVYVDSINNRNYSSDL